MAQTGQTFTAAEVLRAGLQAEAEGRLDYAVQFFRHLTDHHAHSAEAGEARAGLQRIAGRRASELQQQPESWQYAPGLKQQRAGAQPDPRPQVPQGARAAPRQEGSKPAATGVAVVQRQQHVAAAHPPAGTVGVAASEPMPLPPVERRYLVGRIVSGLMQVVGGLTAVLGIGLLGFAVVAGGTVPMPIFGTVAIAGPTLFVLGLVLVFWGQVARAIFDAANATRDLAAIERAKAERKSGKA